MAAKKVSAFVPVVSMTSSNVTPQSRGDGISRRECVRKWVAAAAGTAALVVQSPEPASAQLATGRSIVNSVLSAYGLPTLRDVSGFTPLLEQYDKLVVEFQYPSAWVVQRNVMPVADSAGLSQANGRMSMGSSRAPMEGRASGLTAGDYRKAEGLSFFVSGQVPGGVKDIKSVPAGFIADLVTPGDATGGAPNAKVTRDIMDEDGFRVIDTKYESTTVSGYTVGRKGRTRATMLGDGKLYALTGSCTDIRWKKIGDTLETALKSFQVFRV